MKIDQETAEKIEGTTNENNNNLEEKQSRKTVRSSAEDGRP